MQHDGFTTAQDALAFIGGGNARFTLTSSKSGVHYTYKVQAPKTPEGEQPKLLFVSVLNGPNNAWDGDWLYLGFIPCSGAQLEARLEAGRKGHRDAPSFLALDWALCQLLVKKQVPETLMIQHEGRCCRCGRALTHPDSVASGIGPECASRMERAA